MCGRGVLDSAVKCGVEGCFSIPRLLSVPIVNFYLMSVFCLSGCYFSIPMSN